MTRTTQYKKYPHLQADTRSKRTITSKSYAPRYRLLHHHHTTAVEAPRPLQTMVPHSMSCHINTGPQYILQKQQLRHIPPYITKPQIHTAFGSRQQQPFSPLPTLHALSFLFAPSCRGLFGIDGVVESLDIRDEEPAWSRRNVNRSTLPGKIELGKAAGEEGNGLNKLSLRLAAGMIRLEDPAAKQSNEGQARQACFDFTRLEAREESSSVRVRSP